MAIKVDWSVYPDREKRAEFNNRLTPESPYRSVGVSVPEIRKLAKTMSSYDIEVNYIEDILLMGIIISSSRKPFQEKIKDFSFYEKYIVSWMATDITSSSLYLKKNEYEEAFSYFRSLLGRKEPMVQRFGVVNLLSSFFTEEYWKRSMDEIIKIESDHYLLNMAIAWALSVAYVKHPKEAAHYFALLSPEVKKMAKQKCRDSRRLTPEARALLTDL